MTSMHARRGCRRQSRAARGTRPSGWLCPLQIAVRWYPWEQEIVYAIFDAVLLADLCAPPVLHPQQAEALPRPRGVASEPAFAYVVVRFMQLLALSHSGQDPRDMDHRHAAAAHARQGRLLAEPRRLIAVRFDCEFASNAVVDMRLGWPNSALTMAHVCAGTCQTSVQVRVSTAVSPR